nr:MAG TPA: hypothetical protein [Caudoviricetes sp.]
MNNLEFLIKKKNKTMGISSHCFNPFLIFNLTFLSF